MSNRPSPWGKPTQTPPKQQQQSSSPSESRPQSTQQSRPSTQQQQPPQQGQPQRAGAWGARPSPSPQQRSSAQQSTSTASTSAPRQHIQPPSSPPQRQRQEPTDTRSVVEQLKSLTVSKPSKAIQPGTTGKRIMVTSNHYRINKQYKSVYRYNIEFDNPSIEQEQILLRRMSVYKFKSQLSPIFGTQYVYDGMNLTTITHVKESSMRFTDPQSKQVISIRYIDEINTDVNNELNQTILNNFIKQYFKKLKMIQINNAYFDERQLSIRGSREHVNLLSGFRAVVYDIINTQAIIEIAHKPVSDISVYDVMKRIENDVMNDNRITSDNKQQVISDRVNGELRGTVVLVKYSSKTHRIDLIDYNLKPSDTFTSRDGSSIAFKDHVKSAYALNSKQTTGGMIVNYPRKKDLSFKIVLMPEHCYCTGISDQMRSDNKLMQVFASHTRMSPNDRHTKQVQLIQRILAIKSDVPISVNPQEQQINARILGPFELKMGNSSKQVDGSGFLREAAQSSVVEGNVNIRSVAVIYESEYQFVIDEIMSTFNKLAGKSKIMIDKNGTKYYPIKSKQNIRDWETNIKSIIGSKPQVCLSLVPYGNATIYSLIKQQLLNDTTDIVTQCMSTDKILFRGDIDGKKIMPICGNVIKQIGAKLGYRLWRVDLSRYVSLHVVLLFCTFTL